MLNNADLNRGKLRLKPTVSIILSIILIMSTSCNKNDEDDIQKLEALKQAYLWNLSTEKGLEYIYKLKHEASKLKNDRYIGTAYYFLARSYLTDSSKRDSVLFALEEAKIHYRRAGYKRGEIITESYLANYLIAEGSYELALRNIYSLLAEMPETDDYYQHATAYSTLAKIYLYLNKPNEALDTSKKVSEIYQKMDDSSDILNEYNYNFFMLAIAATHAKKYDLALSYVDSLKNGLSSLKLSDFFKKQQLYHADIVAIECLLDMNRIKEAEVLLDSVFAYINEFGNINEQEASVSNMMLSKYYLKKHDYEKALEYNNSVTFSKNSEFLNYMLAQELRADILFAKGNYADAFRVKDEIFQFSDSVKSSNISRQLNTFEVGLQKEMLEKENELKDKYTYTVIISLSIVCILLLSLLWITLRNAKKLKKKNELIFSQFRDLDKYTDKIKEGNNLSQEVKPNQVLFEKIKSYLCTTESFRNTDISRESLAMEFGTNRQYLTEAILENTGMTFMEYITEMRLEYARRLLCYNIDLPIDEVYMTSGFNSKSTFYRLFKQKYDLTPKEIREIATQNKQGSSDNV